MWTPPPHWPGGIVMAHAGGIPELLTFAVPVALFLIYRRIQHGRHVRRQRQQAAQEAQGSEEASHWEASQTNPPTTAP